MNRYVVAVVLLGMFAAFAVWRIRKGGGVPAGVPNEGGLQTISPSDDMNTKMHKFAEQAVMDAWKYNKVLLDYSPESVEKVEAILAVRQRWCAEKKFTDKDIRAEALILGAYIGEVIRKQYGGTWSEGDDVSGPGSYPLKWGRGSSYPYGWCYKRLTQGPDENVWYKYLYLMHKETPSGVSIEVTKRRIGKTNAPVNPPSAGR